MTHADQTVDVSRATIEKVIHIAGCERWGAGFIGQAYFTVAEVLLALLDAKEKAEQDNARLRQAIERKDIALRLHSPCNGRVTKDCRICEAIAYTGNDDTGEMT